VSAAALAASVAACGSDDSSGDSSGSDSTEASAESAAPAETSADTASTGSESATTDAGSGDSGAAADGDLRALTGFDAESEACSDAEIDLGAVLALTGPGSFYGKTMTRGIDLAVAQIDEVGGPHFNVIYKDHKSGDPAAGQQAITELGESGVPAKLASYVDDLGAMLAGTADYEVFTLDGGGGTSEFGKAQPFFWGTRAVTPNDPLPGLRPDLIWAALADMLLGTLLTGVLCLVAIDVAILRRHSLGQYLRQAARQLLPLLIFTLAISIAIGIGIVFLVVPGLYAAARYLPYAATTVFEDAGWQGITRAETLTRGYRWPLAGLLAVFFLLILLVGIPAGVLAGTLGPVPAFLSEAFFAALGYLLGAAFTAAVYLRLRQLQDGVSTAEIAATVG